MMKPLPAHSQKWRFAALLIDSLFGFIRLGTGGVNETGRQFRILVYEPQPTQVVEHLNGHREYDLEMTGSDGLRNLLHATLSISVGD